MRNFKEKPWVCLPDGNYFRQFRHPGLYPPWWADGYTLVSVTTSRRMDYLTGIQSAGFVRWESLLPESKRESSMTQPDKKPQSELPGLEGSDGSEQLDIPIHELPELQSRLEREGRFISILEVRRQGGYRVTINLNRSHRHDRHSFGFDWFRSVL